MSETRPRRDLTQISGQDRDETESLGVFFYENKLLIKKKTMNLAKFCLKTTNPDQDETETRLSKIEANKTRPRRDCPKKFSSETRPRRDKFQNFV